MFKLFSKRFFPLLLVLMSFGFLSTGWFVSPITSLHRSVPLLSPFSLQESRVAVVIRAMGPEESKRAFGHDLPSRGIQPLFIAIENNTSETYSLSPSSVNIDRMEPSQVAFQVTSSTFPRAIAYKVASFFFWPLMVPGTIDSIRVLTHHKQFKRDLLAKVVKNEVVAPYSIFHRVLFVPKEELQETVQVTLIELESLKASEFDVPLERQE